MVVDVFSVSKRPLFVVTVLLIEVSAAANCVLIKARSVAVVVFSVSKSPLFVVIVAERASSPAIRAACSVDMSAVWGLWRLVTVVVIMLSAA